LHVPQYFETDSVIINAEAVWLSVAESLGTSGKGVFFLE
jgi:hypothetical protein